MLDVTSVELWQADGSARIDLPDGETGFARWVEKFEVNEVLSEVGRQETKGSVELANGAPPAVSDPPLFTHRRIVRVNYLDADGNAQYEEFRIVRFVRQISGGGNARLEIEPIWMDLSSTVSKHTISATPPRVDLEWYLIGVTPAKALQEIMAREAPAGWSYGSVPTEISGASVFLHSIGNSTLELIRALCMDITVRTGQRCEWDYVRSGSGYEVSLSLQLGGTINHPIEGYKEDSKWNRRKLSRTLDATKFFTRVVPIGGPDGEHGTIANATFLVDKTETGKIYLEGDPIYLDGSPSAPGLRLVIGGVGYPVTGTEAPNIVSVSGSVAAVAAGDEAVFRIGKDGELTYLADGATEAVAGIKERPYRRSDIPPYKNLLIDAGVSPDLSTWASSLPSGVARSSADVTVTRVTDPLYVSAGTAAMRVEADAGGYIETAAVDLSGTGPTSGYTSLWVNMRVLSGAFRLALIGPNGETYPPDEEAVGVADEVFRGLSIGGLHPPQVAGYKVRLTALEDGTVFVVDSWTVTRSSGPFEYTEDMGPNALWDAAGGLLAGEGGVLPDRVEGSWIDLSQIEPGTYDPVKIGAKVMVADAGVAQEARLSQVKRKYASGIWEVTGILGNRPADVTAFATRQGRSLGRSRVGAAPLRTPLVLVTVEQGIAAPVIRVAYPAGVKQVRLEIPLPPTDTAAYNFATGGSFGTAPVPQMGSASIGVKTFDSLIAAGGELEYTVGTTELDNSTTEAVLPTGQQRGEYRVYALLTPNDLNSAVAVWAGTISGPVAAPAVTYDSLFESTVANVPPAVGTTKIARIVCARATGGTLVWKVDAGDYAAIPSVLPSTGSASVPAISVSSVGVDCYDFYMVLPDVGSSAVTLTLAVRTGAGTTEDPYEFLDPKSATIVPPPLDNVLVESVPADGGGRPEGTLIWLPETT